MVLKYVSYNPHTRSIKGIIAPRVNQSRFIKLKLISFIALILSLSYLHTFFYEATLKLIKPITSLKEQFVVKEINIYGNSSLDSNNILNHIDIYLGQSITELSLSSMIGKLNQLMQVKSAEITLKLPCILNIYVTEHQPRAIWKNGNKFFLINEEGDVVGDNISNVDKSKYIIIFGNNANFKFRDLENLLINNHIYDKVASLYFINQRRWNIFLNNGTLIKLPSNNIESAVEKLSYLLKQKEFADVEMIDLRLSPKRLYIKRHNH